MTAIEIDDDGKEQAKRRFDARDWDYIAEWIIAEYETRKRKRGDLERQWAEIDRQVAMVPDIQHKKLPDGRIDTKRMWMAEMELPLQAQALEVLTADARRMMFPDSGAFFRAHAETTDEYLRRVDFKALVMGDENDVPSQITQDNADKLVEGFLSHIFGQYDLASRMDRINAEAFRYGMGVGRGRMETANVYIHEARGVRKESRRLPVLVPVSIKNLYLDTPMPSMHSAQVLGDAPIAEDFIRLENLQIAASRGANDPYDEDGGWMPQNARKLVADDNGFVRVLEMEGDIVVPRKTVRSVVIPGAIVTVVLGAAGADGKATRCVIRFRYRSRPFSSYLLFPYHYESAGDAYPTSPLMKGRTVQIAAVQACNRVLDAAALKNSPPVGYDKSQIEFASQGGPVIHPFAQWATIDEIKVYTEVGGDPAALQAMMSMFINLYSELTGILPSRLGAQTVSHTTAFAKDAELQRGAVRTVDYVRQIGDGAMTRWLDMAYRMGREALGAEKISFYIAAYGGFVAVEKTHLPDAATFEWFGAGGPAEEQAKKQAKLASLSLAMQMDQVAAAFGAPPSVDVPSAIREVIREGGWTDVDAIIRSPGVASGAPPAPALPAPAGGAPGALPVALQAIQGSIQ